MIDQRKNTQFILARAQSMKELGYVKKLAPRAAIDWTLLDQVIAENQSLYAGLKLKTTA
jgi:NitT/TauT family transport system substrate-binding protein